MNVLQAIAVELSCLSCGQKYRVALDVIAASHRALHEGCPVSGESVRECPQEAYAQLVDEHALVELERAWTRVEQQLAAVGGRPTIYQPRVASPLQSGARGTP